MSETGFKCPECGNTKHFTATQYYVYNAELSIGPDGWTDNGKYGEIELPPSADLECCECGHSDNWHTFVDDGCVDD